jgi:rhodanese-related sulfurtransferase
MGDDLRITVHEVGTRMQAGEQFVFVDTRNPQAWAESAVKLPGALRIPADQLEKHLFELPKNKPIVAYCT